MKYKRKRCSLNRFFLAECCPKINQIFLEEWGCPPQAITISLESVAPENWERVVQQEIEPNAANLMICNGQKQY